MYNDTIRVANKIITDQNLADIFNKMQEEIESNKRICKQEEIKNEKYEREYQEWTTKNYEGEIKVTIDFYDDTNITIDNYSNFMAIFYSRVHEIKEMWIRFRCSYWVQPQGGSQDYISQHINMNVYENKMNIEINLSSSDKKMDDVYQYIKSIILNAPEKYDRIIKKKSLITNKISFGVGAIPSIIILTLLVLIPTIREIYAMTYIVFPIAITLLSFIIGGTVFGGKLDDLYKNIVPEKKYAGYDSTNYKSIYKDDIDNYVGSSEILIGKNVDNLKCREEIQKIEEKYSSYIKYEIIAILVLSLLMIIVGKLT